MATEQQTTEGGVATGTETLTYSDNEQYAELENRT